MNKSKTNRAHFMGEEFAPVPGRIWFKGFEGFILLDWVKLRDESARKAYQEISKPKAVRRKKTKV